MKMIDIRRYHPPGMEIKGFVQFFVTGFLLAGLYADLFFIGFGNALDNLYHYPKGEKTLIPDAVMKDFYELLDGAYMGYILLAVFSVMMIFFNYIYYFQNGSKSIYLMKRLPNASELHKRSLVLPISMAVISILGAFLCIVILFVIYMIFTPSQCITPGQWQMLWSNLL